MKRIGFVCTLVCTIAIVSLASLAAFAQQQTGNNTGLYGVTGYKVNGQAVASQYAQWSLPSVAATSPGAFAWPASFAYVQLGGGRAFIPFSTSCPLKIIDALPANTETVTPTSVTISASQFALALPAVNAHTSYTIVSGTGGLCEAQKDLGASGGAIIVTQEFYDKGFSAATITSQSGGAAGDFVLDVSSGKNDTYGWNGSNYKLIQTNSNSHFGFGNPDVVGTGTSPVTVTFQKAYAVAPVCLAADQSATPAAVQVAPTTTQVVLTGTAGHTLAYACFGNPN